MSPNRRTVLRLTGVGAFGALAGCLSEEPSDGDGSGNGTGDGTETGDGSDSDPSVESTDTMPFAVRTGRPRWLEPEASRVVLIDGAECEEAVLGTYDLPERRREALREFRSGIDYDTDRLVLVEGVGPDACHDRVGIGSIRAEDDELRADAEVRDSSDAETGCAEAITYPSALARVDFEGEPLDSVAVAVTDGWGETATVTADADDSIGPDLDSLAGSVRPEGDPEPIAPLDCEKEGVRRYPQPFEEGDFSWGERRRDGEATLALRIDGTEYARGDTATVRLTNVSGGIADTGNRAKYSIQAYTESGWQDVRVGDADRPVAYTDEAIAHPPGEAFEWRFELSESGLVDGAFHEGAEVCPDLRTGRYRFAYWGVSEGAVGVAFDLRE